MKRRIVALMMIIFFIFINSATSEDAGRPPQELGYERGDRSGFVLPEQLAKQSDAINSLIKDKNEFEFIRQSQPIVKYNDNGTIESALYDGIKVNYSYQTGDDGDIKSVSLETDSWKIIITDGSISIKEGEETQVYSNENMTAAFEKMLRVNDKTTIDPGIAVNGGRNDSIGKRPILGIVPSENPIEKIISPESKPVIVFYPKKKLDLDVVARKPIKFDFKEIAKILSKAEGLKESAILEYDMNSKQYYDSMEAELRSRGLLEQDQKGADQKSRRQSIDVAVDAAYIAHARDEGNASIRELILLEKVLRREIVIPAREIFKDRVGVMQECLVRVIEQIVESKLAIYLNLDPEEDKMEAVVNLQGASE